MKISISPLKIDGLKLKDDISFLKWSQHGGFMSVFGGVYKIASLKEGFLSSYLFVVFAQGVVDEVSANPVNGLCVPWIDVLYLSIQESRFLVQMEGLVNDIYDFDM